MKKGHRIKTPVSKRSIKLSVELRLHILGGGGANNKGNNSTFVIQLRKSVISKLARSKNFPASHFSRGDWLESLFVGNPKSGFVAQRRIWYQ